MLGDVLAQFTKHMTSAGTYSFISNSLGERWDSWSSGRTFCSTQCRCAREFVHMQYAAANSGSGVWMERALVVLHRSPDCAGRRDGVARHQAADTASWSCSGSSPVLGWRVNDRLDRSVQLHVINMLLGIVQSLAVGWRMSTT